MNGAQGREESGDVGDAHVVPVGTLRRKLTLGGEEPLLETVIGRGYRLRGDT